ncbi:MAG: M14 family metallocarboxypeptidase [Bacteroidales bacterium]|nr:M14 family metallocarboxypeptidase [Bacteroidales bacterium]MDT8432383.1 M14 family metallocarboxypeptidase [Bacteroidales bacterium]
MKSSLLRELDLQIESPAFNKDTGFTDYVEMISFLEEKSSTAPFEFQIKYIGTSQKGKKIPAVIIGSESPDKIRIWLQSGLHGNEPAGTEGLLMYISYLVDQNPQDVLDHLVLMILPMTNIDGYEVQSRYAADGADLNRDQTKLYEPETVALKKAFAAFNPHVAIDIHEYRPYRSGLKTISEDIGSIAYDVLFLPSGNLNIPSPLQEMVHDVYLPVVSQKLTSEGLSSTFYFLPRTKDDDSVYLKMGGASPRSSATSFALSNSVSILFEIRGIGLGREYFKRRTYSSFLLASTVVKTTLENKDRLLSAYEKSIVISGKKKKIILSYSPSIYEDEFLFYNTSIDSLIAKKLEVHDTNRSTAEITRKNPRGYIILPEAIHIAEKLKILGVEMYPLKNEKKVLVEKYLITANSTNGNEDQLAVNNVSVELRKGRELLPKEAYYIPAEQENFGYASCLLEPEMPNGFVNYGVLEVIIGEFLPVYRLLKPKIK